jgi:hypothetical protein
MTSSDDETGPEGSRHRSSEPRISRWRRRHADNEEVGELDPDEVAELLRRAALADRENVHETGRQTVQRADEDDHAAHRVFSDALEMGLADPTPPEGRHLLRRRRHEGEHPMAAADDAATEERARALTDELAARERVVADQSRMLDEAQQEFARSREELDRAAEQLRHTEADLEQAEQRARTLATESAARATEFSERVRALVAERERAEERARELAEEVSAARTKAATSTPAESDDEVTDLKTRLASAEARIRALSEEVAERDALHAERVDALLADVQAAESAAEEARRVAQQAEATMFEVRAEAQRTVEQRTAALSEAHQALADANALAGVHSQARAAAEARVTDLERRLDEAHVLPVFSPVEAEPERVEEPEPADEPEPVAEEPEVAEPEPEPEPVPATTRPARTAPTSYAAKRGSGLVGLLAGLIALACAAAVGWLAYEGTMLDRTGLSIALTVGAVLALGVALRRRAQSSEVHLDRGTLRLRFGDHQHTFYLNSPSTKLEMTGQPGDRDWKVQVLRRGMAPVTIDAKDVDPVAFTDALHQWRPST